MKTIYHAANVIDAQLVVDMLAAAGIQAHVQGAFLSGGIGELPAGEMVRVWVADEDAEPARRAMAQSASAFDDGDLQLEVAPALRRSWQRAWAALGASGDGTALLQRLLDAWSDPQRSYHTLQHLTECIAQLEPQLPLAEHPGEVEFALWFHDAVYDVQARDNELRSARWAADEMLAAGLAQPAVDRVHRLIMATDHNELPESPDEKLLVDVDLAILGAPPGRFAEYEAQVREEFAWVPGWVFRRKRRELLTGFLARPSIYHTEVFRQMLEAPARENLRQSIARLKPWWRRGP